MNAHITFKCGCQATVPVKGPREAKQYKKWLATKKCADHESK